MRSPRCVPPFRSRSRRTLADARRTGPDYVTFCGADWLARPGRIDVELGEHTHVLAQRQVGGLPAAWCRDDHCLKLKCAVGPPLGGKAVEPVRPSPSRVPPPLRAAGSPPNCWPCTTSTRSPRVAGIRQGSSLAKLARITVRRSAGSAVRHCVLGAAEAPQLVIIKKDTKTAPMHTLILCAIR